MRIVLDTASLIAAIRSAQGAAKQVLDLIVRGKISMLIDQKLAYEYREVAFRPTHVGVSTMSAEEIDELIGLLEDLAEPVYVTYKVRPLSVDPNDDMVLDVAINGRADAIVTINKKHFRVAGQDLGIPVLASAELLQRMEESHAE